jgi:hypothetical protein
LAAPNPTAEENFKAYLFSKGTSLVNHFKITIDIGVCCEACICVGSQTYHFKIKKDEVSKLKPIDPFDKLDIQTNTSQ